MIKIHILNVPPHEISREGYIIIYVVFWLEQRTWI